VAVLLDGVPLGESLDAGGSATEPPLPVQAVSATTAQPATAARSHRLCPITSQA
jgi:hypothetical protein